MGLVVFDIGGTAVKYGYWEENQLSKQGKFQTPLSFDELVIAMKSIIEQEKNATGVAVSAPGAVNSEKRCIEGVSAVPYLHHFPIFAAFEEAFNLPVTIENDANCAGISEIQIGAGKQATNAVFIIVGTGVGGSIFINRKLYKGSHLFGGEFGLMKLGKQEIISANATIVKVSEKYAKKTGIRVDGQGIYQLVDQGDSEAIQLLESMYTELSQAIYNIQISLDPDMIILGGGVSAKDVFISEIKKRVYDLLKNEGIEAISPEIVACHYRNDANLIGAAVNFGLQHG